MYQLWCKINHLSLENKTNRQICNAGFEPIKVYLKVVE